MYSEVGKKIMGLAKICGWICLIASVLTWLILITNGYEDWYGGRTYITEDDVFGWAALIFGVLSFISSWPLYGFGQLIDDVHSMRKEANAPVALPNDELPDL